MHPDGRRLLLAQHQRIRELIEAVEAAAATVLAAPDGSPEGVCRLQGALGDLRAGLLPHLDAEEAVLAPLLLASFEDGLLRLALLRAEHTSQRALLELLLKSPAQGPRTCARRTLSFVGELREDLRFEERELFDLLFGHAS